MPRFVFKLEPLLEQRRAQEREKQIVVAKIERERQELIRFLSAAQMEIGSHKRDLSSLLAGGEGRAVRMTPVRLQAGASLHAEARARHLTIKLAGVYKRLHAAQSELASAMAARRAVELLKERRHSEWLHEQARREAAETDDLVVSRHGRRHGGVIQAPPGARADSDSV